VIGIVDNVLRPILIGRETKVPDFLIWPSTLGGLAAFGFNGLLIGPVSVAVFMSVWTMIGNQQAASVADPCDPVAPIVTTAKVARSIALV
jgi:predicted PurR-regulated permease PerM